MNISKSLTIQWQIYYDILQGTDILSLFLRAYYSPFQLIYCQRPEQQP